jgi:predicted aspartyl protease
MGLGAALLPVSAYAQAPVVIKLSATLGGCPVARVAIGGHGPYRFLLDTGASMSLVQRKVAEDLKLREAQTELGRGLGGNDLATVFLADDVVFGDTFRMRHMALRGIDAIGIREIDGALSAGVVTAMPAEFDFAAGELRYFPGGAPDLTGYQSVPAQWRSESDASSRKIYVDVVLDGIRLNALVDTGSSAGLYLSAASVRANGLWDKYPAFRETEAHGTADKVLHDRRVSGDRLDIGPVNCRNVPVVLGNPAQVDAMGAAGIDAILGMGVLRHYRLALPDHSGFYMKPAV